MLGSVDCVLVAVSGKHNQQCCDYRDRSYDGNMVPTNYLFDYGDFHWRYADLHAQGMLSEEVRQGKATTWTDVSYSMCSLLPTGLPDSTWSVERP